MTKGKRKSNGKNTSEGKVEVSHIGHSGYKRLYPYIWTGVACNASGFRLESKGKRQKRKKKKRQEKRKQEEAAATHSANHSTSSTPL